jgi:hypothetical protein
LQMSLAGCRPCLRKTASIRSRSCLSLPS